MLTVHGTGRFAVTDSQMRNRWAHPDRPILVYAHGAGGTAEEIIGALAYGGTWAENIRTILRLAVTELDVRVECVTATGLWNNATNRTRLDDLIAAARAEGGSSGPVVMVGTSMGFTSSAGWAYHHTSDVAGIVGIIPGIDMQAIRVADTLSQRAPIDAAHGVTYPAALPANVNVATLTGTLSAIPQQIWTASNDNVSVNHAAYESAVGAEAHNLGATGHTVGSINAVDAPSVVAFLRECLYG